MMNYSRQETIAKTMVELTNIETLYKAPFINWTGITNDSKEEYTEIIADCLKANITTYYSLASKTRKESYFRHTHGEIKINIESSNRDEENFAKRITGLEFDKLGIICDFQIPLKDTLADKGIGKIDLISFNNDINTMYLIELKYIGNKETLLRAVLESYTYFKIVDKEKLKKDFISHHRFIQNNYLNSDAIENIVIEPAVLLVPSCNAYNELKDMEVGNRPKLKALTQALAVSLLTLEFCVNEI